MTVHPLDPLSAEEIQAAVRVVKAQAGLDASAWFETITLQEPSKEALVEHHSRSLTPPRHAYVCCYEPSSNRTLVGVANLDNGQLLNWHHVPGAQARIVGDEFAMGQELVKKDAGFIEACAQRGIADLDTVLVETWGAGHFGIEEEEGERLAFCHCWIINDAGDNRYGRPIGNLHPVVDLRRQKVVRIEDYGIIPIPPDTPAIRQTANLRDTIKPLEITQRDGPSFDVDGTAVRWQNWHIRVGYNFREGLVLHEIGYEDGGRVRPIMHRASMAEMVVPYGDPSPGNFRRNAFDTGEYGIGGGLDSLKLGCDCLGHIHYFDVCAHDWHGAPRIIENAICMHEEDFGLLWKHTDAKTGTARSARSRRLVISAVATIGNYVYGFFWYFYQDGTIGVEIKATGIPFPSAITPGENSEHGAVIAQGIQSHVHQHAFSFRFDMCIDGPENSVAEVDFVPMPVGPANPHGNGVHARERTLEREGDAARELNMASSRYWKVKSYNARNALGQPTAYKLAPGANALPLLDPSSPVARRGGFMFKHFWATAFADSELYPSGWFPNQDPGTDGLPVWVQQNRSLENADVVAWYTLNFSHLPRPEDWPVQPVVYANFHWMPEGFFDQNPALDVPPNDSVNAR